MVQQKELKLIHVVFCRDTNSFLLKAHKIILNFFYYSRNEIHTLNQINSRRILWRKEFSKLTNNWFMFLFCKIITNVMASRKGYRTRKNQSSILKNELLSCHTFEFPSLESVIKIRKSFGDLQN